MSERAQKLFALLVNEATADGERRNAAAMLRNCMENEGIEITKIAWKGAALPYHSPEPGPEPDWEHVQMWRTMPFGKYKGLLLKEIPSEYLLWILNKMVDAKPWLAATARAVLRERGEA